MIAGHSGMAALNGLNLLSHQAALGHVDASTANWIPQMQQQVVDPSAAMFYQNPHVAAAVHGGWARSDSPGYDFDLLRGHFFQEQQQQQQTVRQ